MENTGFNAYSKTFKIGSKALGEGQPCYIVAEMSANHLGDFARAERIVRAAAAAGADAIKLQTYTADTITLDSDKEAFTITGGTLWDGRRLHDLYEEAYTPWEWHKPLRDLAHELGMECFSSPFDGSAVELMKSLEMPAYKIASYEITDIPLIQRCAETGRPVILATGVARMEDIELALKAIRETGNDQVAVLKCVSAYPTPYEDVNLHMIKTLQDRLGCPIGLSDHSMGWTVPVAAVALGARMVEKHLTLRRSDGGADGAFSMEPEEFGEMVRQIRITEKALGSYEYHLTPFQEQERSGVRSLYVAADIKKGEVFTEKNIRSVRPGDGLPPRYLPEILGKHASHDLEFADPLRWEDIAD